jgi:hypothetical protein
MFFYGFTVGCLTVIVAEIIGIIVLYCKERKGKK